MKLPLLANAILKDMPVNDIKQAAKDFGVSHYYFSQKVKSIETSHTDLSRAVDCMLAVHRNRNKKIEALYQDFLEEIDTELK